MNVFSAVVLLCSLTSNGLPQCDTLIYDEFFVTYSDCVTSLIEKKKQMNNLWLADDKYVKGDTCINWENKRFQINWYNNKK